MAGRWDPCVSHRGAEIDGFVDTYFTRPERRILLVGGAGFDPRSTAVARRLANTEGQIRGLFLQEERPKPTQARPRDCPHTPGGALAHGPRAAGGSARSSG